MIDTRHASRRTGLAALVLVAMAAATTAQEADRAGALHAQLRRIFDERAYDVPRFGPARWLPDGTGYTSVERAAARTGGWDIVRYDAASGDRQVLVAGTRLVPTGTTAPLSIADYAWSPDGRYLLVFTNTTRVWRDDTRGDYWLLDLETGALRRLGGDAPPSALMFAKFSPDSTRVAYVRAHDIYVEGIVDARIVQVTTDGSATTVNGTSDWVYEEELSVRDCFRWSPDGRAIAYWQFDTTGVGSFALINNTDTLYPVVTHIPYPKVGTTNSAVRIGVVPADGGATRWMQTPGDPRDTYLARLEWLDAQTVAMQQLNRLQNQNDVLLGDVRSGTVRRVFRDTSDSWVDVVDQFHWVDEGRAFLWVSERGDWRHVYKVPREGGEPVRLTNFDADALEIAGLDQRGGWLYVIASPANATQRYLYRTRLDGTGTPARVTPADAPGWHTYDVAPDGRLAFHTYSRADQPPVTDVVDLAAHRSLRVLTDTSTLEQALAPLRQQPLEFFTLEVAAGVSLDGWMLKPPDFDATKRYPVIFYVYGEPWNQTVVDRWGGARMLFHRALADAGFVVVSVDNRGTPGPKGTAWRKIVYGSIGVLSSQDQAEAVRVLTARHPFLDAQRVGIWGWSGGGTNTLNAMFRYPDVYQVGVSVAPVPDQQLYDTIYQERYMGLPSGNAEGYRASAAINHAEGLRGRLLIVHGTGDDNVHYQGTERLINRLVELGKPFDMMAYPNRTHAIAEGSGTSLHLHALIARYFVEHLGTGPAATPP
jgi:dipeptidyl-peptidase-4